MSILFRFTNIYDGNLLLKQPSRPSTNPSSKHPPQRNGDVLSDRREWVGGSSTFAEFLSSPCRDKGSAKSKKSNSNKYILANSFFKTTDKIVSSVRQITYSATKSKMYHVIHPMYYISSHVQIVLSNMLEKLSS